jgi:hypothetical protein
MRSRRGPWICLDAPNDNQASRVGIDAEGAGYVVVYRSASRAEILIENGPVRRSTVIAGASRPR